MRTAANGKIEKGALSERGAPLARLAINGGIAYKGWLMKIAASSTPGGGTRQR